MLNERFGHSICVFIKIVMHFVLKSVVKLSVVRNKYCDNLAFGYELLYLLLLWINISSWEGGRGVFLVILFLPVYILKLILCEFEFYFERSVWLINEQRSVVTYHVLSKCG